MAREAISDANKEIRADRDNYYSQRVTWEAEVAKARTQVQKYEAELIDQKKQNENQQLIFQAKIAELNDGLIAYQSKVDLKALVDTAAVTSTKAVSIIKGSASVGPAAKLDLDKAKGQLDAILWASGYKIYPHYNNAVQASLGFKSNLANIVADTGFVVGGATADSPVKQTIGANQDPRSGPHISYSEDPAATAEARASEQAAIAKLQTVLNSNLPAGYSPFQLVRELPLSADQSKRIAVWF